MALPIDSRAYDVAVMPLVIFFVPDPAKGVAELARVVRPGGIVAAYAWDMAGGGFPYAALLDELRAIDVAVPHPPNEDASRLEVMRELWSGAGLTAIDTRVITVQRTFVDFADYWETVLGSPSAGKSIAAMPPDAVASVRARLESALPPGVNGSITCSASANAVKGWVGL
jgi:SAM-dependent methyltransferase